MGLKNSEDVHEIACLLDVLRSREYLSQKYRSKGDAYYDMGNDRISMEHHNLAAEEERRAKTIRAKLEKALGAPGSLPPPDAELMNGIRMTAEALPNPWSEEDGDFDKACFVRVIRDGRRLYPGFGASMKNGKTIRGSSRKRRGSGPLIRHGNHEVHVE